MGIVSFANTVPVDKFAQPELVLATLAGGAGCRIVPHYFFDTRDDDTFIQDDMGVDLPNLEAARAVAATSLAELARDVIAGALRRVLVVYVRKGQQRVLETRLIFEAILLVPTN